VSCARHSVALDTLAWNSRLACLFQRWDRMFLLFMTRLGTQVKGTRLCIWEDMEGCVLRGGLPQPVAVLPWDTREPSVGGDQNSFMGAALQPIQRDNIIK
jgi:hypothetical protein